MQKGLALVSTVLLLVSATTVLASGYPWRDHDHPFDFLFGNHIDTHQQTRDTGNGDLVGFFYIKFTGDVTEDGFPVAMHTDCSMHPQACSVGWKWYGVPAIATACQPVPGQHPVWIVDEVDMPDAPGFSHFHWLGAPDHAKGLVAGQTYDGYLLKLTAVDTFHFKHHGGFDVTPGVETETHANIIHDSVDCPEPPDGGGGHGGHQTLSGF